MAKKKANKKQIKVSKKLINRVEIILITIVLIFVTIFFLNNRTLEKEEAKDIAYQTYQDTEAVLSKVLTGTDWLELEEKCIEKDGYRFCKSKTQGMEEYNDLRNYINSVCTKELTDSILKEKEVIYKEIDKELYVLASNRRKDVFYAGVKEIKVLEIDSHEIKCNVICNYYVSLDEQEFYTMSFDYIISKSFGKWKTNYFELPY